MLKIPYGISNFERIRTKNFLYVDKTHFIKSIESIDYLIHLRPRRFGKSLFISMLESYYDVDSADKFDELFKGLHIHENPTDYRNSYYVLRFDFSGIENVEEDDLRKGFVRKVREGAQAFIGKYKFDIKLSKSSSAATVLGSLFVGFASLNLPHKIYILIDEYDHFTNSILEGEASEFLSILQRGGFVRSFYEGIKERTNHGIVERIFITGVMSITLDSMTSGFNIATKITTNKRFSDMMGFTDDEVKNLLRLPYAKSGHLEDEKVAIQLTSKEQDAIYDVFRENYNGYLFSERAEMKIFNSTLILYYLNYYIQEGEPPRSLVDPNLNQKGATIESVVGLKNHEQNYQIIKKIISEKQIEGTLQSFIDIDSKFDEDDLITLLFSIGMLTIKGFDMETQFEMPNKIIEDIYLQYLSDLVQRQSDYIINTSIRGINASPLKRAAKSL